MFVFLRVSHVQALGVGCRPLIAVSLQASAASQQVLAVLRWQTYALYTAYLRQPVCCFRLSLPDTGTSLLAHANVEHPCWSKLNWILTFDNGAQGAVRCWGLERCWRDSLRGRLGVISTMWITRGTGTSGELSWFMYSTCPHGDHSCMLIGWS